MLAIAALFLVNGMAYAQQVKLDFGGDIAGRPGDSFTIEIRADLGTNEIDNFDFEFKFDNSLIVLDTDGIQFGPKVTGTSGKNAPEPNRIKILTYGQTQPISGSDVLLATITGTLKGSGVNASGFQVSGITIGDNLSTTPSTPVNINVQVSDVAIQLPTIDGDINQTVNTFINTDDLSNLNIASYDIWFTYDASAVSIDGVSTSGTASEGGTAQLNAVNGVAKIGWFSGSNITSNSDKLLNLEMTLKAEATKSPLEFTKVEFYDDKGVTVAVSGLAGAVTVSSEQYEQRYSVTFTTIMRLDDTFKPQNQGVYISGDMLGWNEPGSNPAGKMAVDAVDAGKYSVTLSIPAGTYNYKYFKVATGATDWNNGEWAGDPNRTIVVTGNTVVTELFGVKPGESVFIRDVRNKLKNDDPVTITGIATSPDYGFGAVNLYIQDASAGITTASFNSGNNRDGNTPFKIKQKLKVSGKRGEYNGQIQVAFDKYEIVSENNDLPKPVLLTSLDDWAVDSEYQGMRVTLENVSLPTTEDWPVTAFTGTSGKNYKVSGNLDHFLGDFLVRISDHSELNGSERPTNPFNLTGVMGRFKEEIQIFPFQAIDISVATAIEPITTNLPSEFKLNHNYPNPFNPTTNITYAIPEASQVSMVVFNSLGQKVSTLVNTQQSAGNYTITFNASNLTSGVYFVRIQAGSFVDTKKMLLLK